MRWLIGSRAPTLFSAWLCSFAGMGRLCMILLACEMLPVCSVGQVRGVEALKIMLESIAGEVAERGNEAGMEGVLEHFEMLYNNPLDINGASREELEQLQILSDFQIESLLEYRSSSGNILSATELQLVNGFHKKVVDLLQPFIYFGNGGKSSCGKKAIRSNSTLLYKWWRKRLDEDEYIGPPYYSQLKYKWEMPHRFQMGITLEKDAGEPVCRKVAIPYGDFFSFHAVLKGIVLGRGISVPKIQLGDYSIRMGQGLIAWSGFSLQGGTNPYNVFKRGETSIPYTSSDENRFLRGVAVTIRKEYKKFKKVETTLFYSLKKVDARIKDGVYTSLPKDGLHNTESLAQTRKTLGEIVYGGNITLKTKALDVGVNYLGYGYNAHNGRRVTDYNRYQMYDGQYGNFSADVAAVMGRVRCFAELAMDYGGSFALLCGAMAKLGRWETSVMLRNYPKDYIAPYSGAYSSTSTCSNQRGISLFAQRETGKILFSSGGEYTRYPWPRYNVPGSSSTLGFWVKMESSGGSTIWNAKLYNNYDSYGQKEKLGIKWIYGTRVCNWLQLKMRGESVICGFSETGIAVGADAGFAIWKNKARCILHAVWYNCRSWDSRLYMYEYDLPSSYVSTLLYGQGMRWYVLFSGKIGNRCDLYVKADSGPGVKLGLKMRFF